MKNIVLIVLSGVLFLWSCGPKPSPIIPPIPPTPAVDLEGPKSGVNTAIVYNGAAFKEMVSAKKEIESIRQRAIESKIVVDDMFRKESSFAEPVEELRTICLQKAQIAHAHLTRSGKVLKSQLESLRRTARQLEIAKMASQNSEREKEQLRAANELLASSVATEKKRADDLEKYKEKYYKLLKYRWIVWGLGAWVLVKFLGSLGAWSPQGRMARFLIG